MAPLVYASSIAAYDSIDESHPAPDMKGTPGTIYGVFKRANEGSAQIYWSENGVPSIGLRPHTVYGPGRDQGVTSAPTTAMLAAAAGVAFHLPYGGSAQLQYVPDVARAFIQASLSQASGAHVYDLAGEHGACRRSDRGDRRRSTGERGNDHLRRTRICHFLPPLTIRRWNMPSGR